MTEQANTVRPIQAQQQGADDTKPKQQQQESPAEKRLSEYVIAVRRSLREADTGDAILGGIDD